MKGTRFFLEGCPRQLQPWIPRGLTWTKHRFGNQPSARPNSSENHKFHCKPSHTCFGARSNNASSGQDLGLSGDVQFTKNLDTCGRLLHALFPYRTHSKYIFLEFIPVILSMIRNAGAMASMSREKSQGTTASCSHLRKGLYAIVKRIHIGKALLPYAPCHEHHLSLCLRVRQQWCYRRESNERICEEIPVSGTWACLC